jgi:hypothetical protein
MSAQRNGYRATQRGRVTAGTERDHGVVRIRGGGHRQPPGGTVIVSVTVLVLMLVLTLVVGSVVGVVVVVVVVVVVGSVVVVVVTGGAVVVGVIVSVMVRGGDVGVIGVSAGGVSSDDGPEMRLASPHTISATSTAPSAPNATSAAGLRYQGTASSGGSPCGMYSVGSSGGP